MESLLLGPDKVAAALVVEFSSVLPSFLLFKKHTLATNNGCLVKALRALKLSPGAQRGYWRTGAPPQAEHSLLTLVASVGGGRFSPQTGERNAAASRPSVCRKSCGFDYFLAQRARKECGQPGRIATSRKSQPGARPKSVTHQPPSACSRTHPEFLESSEDGGVRGRISAAYPPMKKWALCREGGR
ncbi:hypothetical protein NDU88_004098 [Pleurodeles waltl]|uniref:Uncharacterized protein n=1 Tax=Pleurodeles waltl TaxID=8319 RepID=A0AAV7SHS6_PLEWA|nr:hypothetical protein NDU88_004098 [Pleurodeles waltl]